MIRISILVLVTFCLTSCATTTSLYYWGKPSHGVSNYEDLSYRRYDKESPKIICKAIVMYEDLLTNAGGSRRVPPPGICAEYAHMLLQADIVNLFNENATQEQKEQFAQSLYGSDPYTKAIKLLEKEIELYPESAHFIKPLITKFKK